MESGERKACLTGSYCLSVSIIIIKALGGAMPSVYPVEDLTA
jgi:hypothetical protein